MERIDYLGPKRLALIQTDAAFPLGMDSMLLAQFATLRRNSRVFDLGCGIGTLMLLLFSREENITAAGIDIQEEAVLQAEKNLSYNSLLDKASIQHGDLRTIPQTSPPGQWDLVISNPPYFAPSSGKQAKLHVRAQTRTALFCSPEDLCKTAAHLLHPKGRFALVLRPEYLERWMLALHHYGLTPKRLRCVHHTPETPPSILLLESVRCGKMGITILPPLFAAKWNAHHANQPEIPTATVGQEE